MAVNTGKIQGKHREFNLNLNVATLFVSMPFQCCPRICPQGMDVTILCFADGFVHSCGNNNKGQLGIGHREDVTELKPVSALKSIRVNKVAGGWDFSLAVSGSLLKLNHLKI